MKSRGASQRSPAGDKKFERTTRWLVRIDGFDHGPFKPSEVRERIRDGRLTLRSDICEERDGRWVVLEEIGPFNAFCEQLIEEAKERAKQEEMDRAETQVRREHKVAGNLPYFLLGGGLVAAAIAAYFLTRAPNMQPSNWGGATIFQLRELGALEPWESFSGEREHAWRFGPEAPPADMSARKRRRSGGRRVGGGDKIYEEGGEAPVEYTFDFGDEGGTARALTSAEIQGTIKPRAIGLLAPCLQAEATRRPDVQHATFRFTLLPNGRVAGPRVLGAMSGHMHSCTRRALRQVRVEPFSGGPRGISLSLSVTR